MKGALTNALALAAMALAIAGAAAWAGILPP